MSKHSVEISYKTIIFTLLLLLAIWFLYTIRSVLLTLFIAVIIMSALNPVVKKMEKFKIPRNLSIILLFIAIIILFAGLVAAIIPASVSQTKSLINQIPLIIRHLGLPALDQQVLNNQLSSLPGNIAKFIVNAFSNIVSLFTLFVIAYYLLAERSHLHKHLVAFLGNDALEKKVEIVINELEYRIGGWVRGQITLMLIIGIFTYLGLTLLNVNYALPLALIAGLFEIVPNIGPTLAAVPAILIATSTTPLTALATLLFYFLLQQIENTVIVPKVMQKAVGVKPLTTILSLMIGLKLAGFSGIILAIPGFLMLKIILEQLLKRQ